MVQWYNSCETFWVFELDLKGWIELLGMDKGDIFVYKSLLWYVRNGSVFMKWMLVVRLYEWYFENNLIVFVLVYLLDLVVGYDADDATHCDTCLN